MARIKRANTPLTEADHQKIKQITSEEPSIILRAEKIKDYFAEREYYNATR